jgi:hypothetical protein
MKNLSLKTIAVAALLMLLGTVVFEQKKSPKITKPKTTVATKTAASTAPASGSLTNDEISFGLKDALSNGVNYAVNELHKPGGFYNNLRVKIPMPKPLQPVEKTLRFLKQDDLADDFVHTMNRAAEEAVAEGINVFADAIKQMTFENAKNILTGPEDSATQFFKRTSEEKLRAKFLPIVKTSTSEMGVTAQYKELMKKGGGLTAMLGQKDFDIDQYVTQKALDGLFIMVADEEKRIRENPVARTTSILKKVFGNILK